MIQDLFPPSTRVNRIVLKRTFIDKLGANARVKERFTRDVVMLINYKQAVASLYYQGYSPAEYPLHQGQLLVDRTKIG